LRDASCQRLRVEEILEFASIHWTSTPDKRPVLPGDHVLDNGIGDPADRVT
jgi:hypothetical protein